MDNIIKERDGYDGVCAHNSTKSGFESDSYDDRKWLMTKVLSRTGTVDYIEDDWTSFKEIVKGITKGCIESEMALIGGETAEHPKTALTKICILTLTGNSSG